jgi:Holliday junction resolvase
MVKVPRIRSKKGPEAKIQDSLIKFLRYREWLVIRVHGNQYSKGFPDLFCAKRRYGTRWLEVKHTFSFTDDQLETFPKLAKHKIGIWVLNGSREEDYQKLFGPPNWAQYLNVAKIHTKNRAKQHKEPVESKRYGSGPERELQDRVILKLEEAGYFVKETHGSLYQSGLPDLYAVRNGRQCFIELKVTMSFTAAQRTMFPKMAAEAVPVWVLTDENDINLLEGKPNWHTYML